MQVYGRRNRGRYRAGDYWSLLLRLVHSIRSPLAQMMAGRPSANGYQVGGDAATGILEQINQIFEDLLAAEVYRPGTLNNLEPPLAERWRNLLPQARRLRRSIGRR